MGSMLEDIRNFLFHNPDIGTKIFLSFAIILILLVARRVLMAVANRRLEDQDQLYAWRKGTEYAVIIFGVVSIVSIWIDGVSNLSTYLGLLSAGVAIALQDPIVNFIGWIYIISRYPFEVGDRIEIDGVSGDVIDIHLLKFSMIEIGNWVDADQSTGRILHVPNRMVFAHPIANFTSGISHIWNEIPVMISFESDWQKAKKLLQQVAERHSLEPTPEDQKEIRKAAKRQNVRVPLLTPVVYTKVSESGVVLTLRYLCRPRNRRNSEQDIWEDVLILFAEQDDLDFAYPTQRVFYHPVEGKTLQLDHTEVSHPRNHLMDDMK